MMNRCDYCNDTLRADNQVVGMVSDFAYCDECDNAMGLENEHFDSGHPEPIGQCPTCFPESDRAGMFKVPAKRKGHHNTRPKTRGDHTACYIAGTHPKTPAGRAECRKARTAPAPEVPTVPMDHTCPVCGVGSAIPCRTKNGRATATHAARKALV